MKTLAAIAVTFLTANAAMAAPIPVLEYHEIISAQSSVKPSDTIVTVDQFNAQMAWLKKNGYTPITAATLAKYMKNPTTTKVGTKPIVISLDDGWENQFNAIPALKKNNFTATFNIIASYPDAVPSYMGWKQIKRLSKFGYEIGSHSYSHPVHMDSKDFEKEISVSRQIIEHQINKKVSTIAWPNGDFTTDMIEAAIIEYDGALTIDDNWCTQANKSLIGTTECVRATGNSANQNPYLIKRVFIDGRCNIEEFGLQVSQGHTFPCRATRFIPANDKIVTPEMRAQTKRDYVDPKNDGMDHGHADSVLKN